MKRCVTPLALTVTFTWLLVGPLAFAQEKAKPAASGEMPAHIQAAHVFLTAWGKGDWAAAKAVAAEKVQVKAGDKVFSLDLESGKAEVTLSFPFKGISTVRVEGKVKGVTVEEIGLKTGGTERRGKGTLTLEEKDGKFLVTGVAVE